jgi:CubicO group peptidase (beta-lactamase class C family)
MDRTDSELLPNNANLQAKKLPRDMAKLGAIYLNKGLWKGSQIVSEEWVERSLESKFNVPEVGANYGYQWWSRNLLASNGISYKCNYASGNGGQFIMIIKELNLVAIFTGGNFSGGGYAYQIMQKHILPSFE